MLPPPLEPWNEARMQVSCVRGAPGLHHLLQGCRSRCMWFLKVSCTGTWPSL